MEREGRNEQGRKKANKDTLVWDRWAMGFKSAGVPLKNPVEHTLEWSHSPSKEAEEFIYHIPSLIS